MRRILSYLLLLSMFALPAFVGCYPSGYNEENPNRPPENQVDTENLGPGDAAPTDGATDEQSEGA